MRGLHASFLEGRDFGRGTLGIFLEPVAEKVDI
jgi:hypothetical protein